MTFDLSTLPTLGLGVSLSVGEKPDPLKLMSQVGGPQFIEYAGLCDVQRILADVNPLLDKGVPILFHPSFINFCGSFRNSHVWLETAHHHLEVVKSPWFAQDCAYCFWGEGYGYSSQFGYFIPPILNEQSLEQAVERVMEVKRVLDRPLAIEPPPVSYVIGTMSPMEFFGRLAILGDCGLLLDVGHLYSYQLATGIPVADMLNMCPTDRVIELHVAGGLLKTIGESQVYLDAHENPIVQPVFDLLEVCLPCLTNLKAVCYECEGITQEEVLPTLGAIREQVVAFSANQRLVNQVIAGTMECSTSC